MTPLSSSHAFIKAMGAFVVVKSVVLGISAALIDVAFVKAAILVVLSAVVTGVFGLVVALIQDRADRRVHARLDALEAKATDTQRKVGADRRQTDPDADTTPPTA